MVCLRMMAREGKLEAGHSLVLTIGVQGDLQPTTELPPVVGWERSASGQLGPRLANMRASMDPAKLAEASVDLNLKLMKWRLVPGLDLDKIKNTR